MKDAHFDLLMERYLGGELDADGIQEFERILMSDRRARASFWRDVKLDSALIRLGGETWGRLLDTGRRRKPRAWLVPAAAAAAIGIAALGLWSGRSQDPENRADPSAHAFESSQTPPGMAVLREAAAAVATDGRVFRSGDTLGAETFQLQSGSILAILFSGTQVALDAPAHVGFPDDSSVELLAGAIRAEVPAATGGFHLLLPGARIEANATQLAAWVNAEGLAGVRIGVGEALARQAAGGDVRRLAPGDYTVTADGIIHEGVPADLIREFPFPEPPPVSHGERQQMAMQEWQSASDARVGDESLLLYLRFLSSRELIDGLLVNEGGHHAAPPGAVLVSGNWVEGRWPGKRALLFQSAADRARFQIEGQHEKLTLCAWIQPWGLDSSLNALVMSQWGIPGEVHWQFSQNGELRFGIRPINLPPGNGTFHRVFADPLLPLEQRGGWHHLATSYDADAREVIHYLDGREVKRGTLTERIPLAFGHATIGNSTNPPPDVWGPRPFGGAVDELAIFSRVLPPDEIRQLHLEGAPTRLPQN
jgi:hypothetical protein